MALSLPKRVANRLQRTLFSKIWNEPDSRSRANFKLSLVQDTVVISGLDLGYTRLMMPITGIPFRVYAVNKACYQGYGFAAGVMWNTAATIMANQNVDITTYDYSGRLIDPTQVYLYPCPYSNLVYVAIPNYILAKCVADTKDVLYQTVFLDTDTTTSTPLFVVTVTDPAKDFASIQSFVSAIPSGQDAFVLYCVNGLVILPEVFTQASLTVGDLVVVGYDPDIAFSVDIAVDDQLTGYYSDSYAEYRELLHAPKALNPNNQIIRAEDVSLVIYDPVTKAARYLHRLTDNFLENVTHNDLSVSRATLNAFRDAMVVDTVHVRVLYRLGAEPRYLTHDYNAIETLYQLSDQDIIDFLLGIKEANVPEWKATNLEKSGFMSMMSSIPNDFGDTILSTTQTAVGWYQTANLLTQMKSGYVYKNADERVGKPDYLAGQDVAASVFANGLKVPDHGVTITQLPNDIQIGFNPGSDVATGSRIDVQLSAAGARTPKAFTPTEDTPSITVGSSDYQVFLQDTPDQPITGLSGDITNTYSLLSSGDAHYTISQSGSSYSVTFDSRLFGKTCYLIPMLGREVLTFNIDKSVAAGDPILLPLTLAADDGTTIPVVEMGRVSVYINGHRLVPDLDYTNTPYTTNTTQYAESVVVVSNLTYLLPQYNVVEVVVDDFKTLFHDSGYIRSGVCWRTTKPWVWLDQCSNVFVRGGLETQVTDQQSYLNVTSAQQDASPFYSEVLLDYTVAKFLSDTLPNADYDVRNRSDALVPKATPDINALVVLEQPYQLYSPYLTQIIKDLVSGGLQVGKDESDAMFLMQFAAYDILKVRDPVIGLANPAVNRNFVDITVSYKNPTVTDLLLIQCIDRLTNLVFNNKTPTLENTYL